MFFIKKLFVVFISIFLIGKINAQKELRGKWKICRTRIDTALTSDATDSTVSFNYYRKKFEASLQEKPGDTSWIHSIAKNENRIVRDTRMKFSKKGKLEMISWMNDSLKKIKLIYQVDPVKKIVSWKNPETGKENSYSYEVKNGMLFLSNKKKKLELIKVR